MTMMMAEQLADGTSATTVPQQQLDHAVETAEPNMTEVAANTRSSIRRSISDAAATEPNSRVERPLGRSLPRRNNTFVEKFFQKSTTEQDAPQPQLRLTIKREAGEESKKKKKMPPRRAKSYGPVVSMPPTRNSRKPSPTPPGRTMTKEDVRRQLSSEDSSNHGGANMLSLITGQSDQKKEMYGNHTGAVESLSYGTQDLQNIANDKEAFAKLKKTLKKHGAVTNEVLKQVLPLYVKHHQNKNSLSSASAHCTRTAPGGRVKAKEPQNMRATVAVSPVRGDNDFPSRGRRAPRSDRRKQTALSPIRRSRSPKSDPKHFTASLTG